MVNKNEKTITISFQKALAILAGSILTGIVATAFTIISTLNTDHFVLLNATQRIDTIEANYVPRTELEQRLSDICNRLDRLEAKIDRLLEK